VEAEKIRERGGEYGAVTGRPRRCGWFDVPAARYSARINHLAALIITKLDILDPLPEIPVGVEYEYKGKRFKDFPPEIESLEQMKVHYHTVPGWQKHTYGAQDLSQLPSRAHDYLKFLADHVGVKVAMVSTGPEREQCVWMDESVVRRP
jgi:adenylosuccinate synthase